MHHHERHEARSRTRFSHASCYTHQEGDNTEADTRNELATYVDLGRPCVGGYMMTTVSRNSRAEIFWMRFRMDGVSPD